MDERNKNLFWLAAAAAFAIVCVPTMTLLDDLQRYHRFLTGFEPGTMRQIHMRSTPHRGDAGDFAPKLTFVDFKLKAPKAKKVELVGEFNGWKPGTLVLVRKGDGWALTVPLPPGRYHYLFVVDGTEKLDPQNRDKDAAGGRPASVKVVR